MIDLEFLNNYDKKTDSILTEQLSTLGYNLTKDQISNLLTIIKGFHLKNISSKFTKDDITVKNIKTVYDFKESLAIVRRSITVKNLQDLFNEAKYQKSFSFKDKYIYINNLGINVFIKVRSSFYSDGYIRYSGYTIRHNISDDNLLNSKESLIELWAECSYDMQTPKDIDSIEDEINDGLFKEITKKEFKKELDKVKKYQDACKKYLI